jgi:hypothetical protein
MNQKIIYGVIQTLPIVEGSNLDFFLNKCINKSMYIQSSVAAGMVRIGLRMTG